MDDRAVHPVPPLLHRVLIVGGGLTGLLTGMLMRQKWNKRMKDQHATATATPPPIPNFPRLHLTIWERASYNAGRFGAAFEHDGEVVDMGAQVLTVADPSHHNAGAGGTFRPCTLQHNSSTCTTAVLKACRLVRQCNVYAS